ncbi:MAG: GPR endopeptidase [Firmicutes bacterium]|nr:GPR endopeptidase [Bacillota bacterium]
MPQAEWQQRGIRTDLAMEAHELAGGETGRPLPGVRVEQQREEGNTITRITVEDEAAGRALGKLPGHYVTIQTPDLQSQNRDKTEILSRILAREIEGFLDRLAVGPEDLCFVAGLGNWASTPDSIGPKVVRSILVTRHLWDFSPPEKRGGLRPVCTMAPGVLGITGLETSEIIFAIVGRIRPRFVVAVDALAARTVERLGTTIQLSDTGIHPGSGLGNNRIGLTPGFLGVPVVAIGIPTVVYASTIVADALEKMGEARRGPAAGQRDHLRRVLSPELAELVVTPKEIDLLVDEVAKVVAAALNIALHPGVGPDEVFRYL